MKLKYYLRGIGVGVVITTIIFMISISIHKNETGQQDTTVPESTAQTVADTKENSTENLNAAETDFPQADLQEDSTQVEEPVPETEPESESESETENALSSNLSGTQTPDSTTSSQEKVRFEIGGGEYSDVICRRLKEAGLIDDAEAFNRFLIEKDYDNLILPGVYDIPKDSTYEEIAVLLVTKVDKKTAEQ